jgi:hypothetical protein
MVFVSWQWALPLILVAILMIPLYDTLRICIIRKLNGQSIFVADNNHVHHQLINDGLTHRQTTIVLLMINLFTVGAVFFLTNYLTINQLAFSLAVMSALFMPTYFFIKRTVLRNFINDPQNNDVLRIEGMAVVNDWIEDLTSTKVISEKFVDIDSKGQVKKHEKVDM